MSRSVNQSEGVPLSTNNENSSTLPVVQSRTQTNETTSPNDLQHLSAERIVLDVKRLIQVVSTPRWESARRRQDWVSFHQELEQDFAEFKLAYPALFRMAIEQGRSFDMNQLIQFLQLREQMMSGAVQEQDAHRSVGQAMVDKYVMPNLPENSRRR